MPDLLPLFLNLAARQVVLVGGGPVAAGKLRQLLAAGADVRVIAPQVTADIEAAGVSVALRPFAPNDLDDAWLAVAAATPDVNRAVAAAAHARRIFVNAVDDPLNASAFMGAVTRRGPVTIAVSTGGHAPALAALVRDGVAAIVPEDLEQWAEEACRARTEWRADGVAMDARKPRLLEALNRLYSRAAG